MRIPEKGCLRELRVRPSLVGSFQKFAERLSRTRVNGGDRKTEEASNRVPPWAIVRKARNMNSGRGTPGEEEPLPASFSTVVKVGETAQRSTVRGRRLYTSY